MLGSKNVRLVLVGGSAAGLFFVLTYLFVSAGGPPFLSSVAAYAIAFVFAYTAQHAWTFGGQHKHGSAFPRYLAAQIFCALLSGLVSQIASMAGAPAALISGAAMLASSGASFLLVRFWVFSDSRTRP